MELVYNDNFCELYNGNMLDMISSGHIKPMSIDCIVTDPPYELNFMGKSWDNQGVSFQKETWKVCYDVLKPGGYLLAFGGSRTFHRIAVAIEDAGFEIRDTIMWIYGCLSEDTEVLTEDGFKTLNDINEKDVIRVYDIKNGVYKWEKPERWNVYKVNEDTCYRIKSDCTDQLVSRNHRCLVEREGELVFKFAEDLCRMETVPVLWNDISVLQKGQQCILFKDMQWQNENISQKLFSEWERHEESEKVKIWRKESGVERWGDLSEQERELYKAEYKVCKVSEGVHFNGEERWVCDGAQTTCSERDGETFVEDGSCTSYKSQCGGQQVGESNVVFDKHGTQDVRGWRSYRTTLATVTEETYTGIIFCPTVSTGCFVARRNGKVFITGNSGFPKSMNIGLAIDKKNGIESKVVGYADTTMPDFRDVGKKQKEISGIDKLTFEQIENSERKQQPIYEAQNKWQGWGTCLKPAFEPVIVARKPFDGSLVDNVLKYGVGGLNIDECRVGSDSQTYKGCGSSPNKINNQEKGCTGIGMLDGRGKDTEYTVNGRFPANLILTYDEADYDEVCGGFPSSDRKNGTVSKVYDDTSNIYGDYKNKLPFESYGDSGSASRYFYCAKASKKDREEGCELLDNNYFGASNQAKAEIARGNVDADMKKFNKILVRKNIHPSVKPAELMQYLVRLVAPKGATILDPFMGSGSTGKAVMFENRERNADYKFIGIELSEEYLPIAEARIKFAEGFELDNKEAEKTQKHPRKSVEKSQKSHEKMFEKWGFDV